jgi:hypothetical protein
MMYCSKCGQKIDIEAAYCPKCGNALEKEPVIKEPVKVSGQDSQQTWDSNEIRAIRFDMKNAKRGETAWSILSAIFLILIIPYFLVLDGSDIWYFLIEFVICIICAVVATIYNSKVKKCKKELIRLGASPKYPDKRVQQPGESSEDFHARKPL